MSLRPSVLSTALLAAAVTLTMVGGASAYDCASPDPAQWPASSKPYFMVIVDTSGSMTTSVSTTNSCGYPNNRIGHARCAVRNAINAYSGQVNFGLAGYAWRLTGCSSATCFTGCTAQYSATDNNNCGPLRNEPGLGSNVHAGANIFVPMLQDHYWVDPPATSNVGTLLGYVNNDCTGSTELGASSSTPLGGSLFNMNQYFAGTFIDPFTGSTLTSPLGTLANGERSCRPLNVILITDGDETCDTGVNPTPIAGGCRAGQAAYLGTAATGERLASYEADKLWTNGITFGSQNFKVRTHVIGFAGASTASLNHIASCGGTTASYSTADEAQLSQALSTIIGSSVSPESCDNSDNNCNGCVDEGYQHYCDVGQSCCAWTSDTQRNTCISNYQASITPANPGGNLALLPCTTAAQQTDSAHWLCYNPGDVCDGTDNNCQSGIDEGATKCGSPSHCPSTEICNGQDDDCDGLTDEGGVCGSCGTPSPEACDGCDNDCNGIADDNVPTIPCGLPSPANCVGVRTCSAPQAVPLGGCVSGGYGACSNNPQTEICDGIDNDCDGVIDNGIAPVSCVPPSTPPGLVFGGASQCQQGSKPCGGTCQGFVGPSAEICDGIDNDCDGTVDENAFGVGQPCGVNTAPCTPGVVACVAGALVCQGGVQPTGEICDGIDNDCDGQTDEAPLSDAPDPGMGGCWNSPGNCCSHENAHWCPPAGATCNDTGSLTAPCNTGSLVCGGAVGWVCQGGTLPSTEVCDGIDNNCNGGVDEGPFPQEGQPCGTDTGECNTGVIDCAGGVLDCIGDVGPSPELCDGLDNDCDGQIDNGIPTGGPCAPDYDAALYPGQRDFLPCQPGVLECDGNGGLICVGGVGPSPEACDGIDNDCDGTVDEPGAAPDGIDGSANPFPPPAPQGHLGDSCGTNQGSCTAGNYVCLNGQFACAGATSAVPETCDCNDNDCNGVPDNHNPNDNPPLCGTGKDCVHSSEGCQCAKPCDGGEFPCPAGQTCEVVTSSETGRTLGSYCIASTCPDCTQAFAPSSGPPYTCAPAGTPGTECSQIPVCECKGQNGCQAPCSGVTCDPPFVCTNFGPHAGECVQNDCFDVPCQGCSEVCDSFGICKPSPCDPNPCTTEPNTVCKPTDDFAHAVCVATCSGVDCATGTVCQDGACVPTCSPPCSTGQVCDDTQNPPTCVADQCIGVECAPFACCDSLSGTCGACPCEGVVCPDGQKCDNDQCVLDMGEGGSTSVSTGSESVGQGGSSSGSGNGGSGPGSHGVFGLPTGGGGCSCDVGGHGERPELGLVAIAVGAAVSRLRRRKKNVSAKEASR